MWDLYLLQVEYIYTPLIFALLQVMDTLAEIQERHDTVRELERKLLELQQVTEFLSHFTALFW